MKKAVKPCGDISGKIGPFPERFSGDFAPTYPMYSFSGPSFRFWQGIARGLSQLGKSEKQILEILQSKLMRWELDGDMSDEIEALGEQYALKHGLDWKL